MAAAAAATHSSSSGSSSISSLSAPTLGEQPLTGSTSNAPIWLQEAAQSRLGQVYSSLTQSESTRTYDVAVVGGGIFGVTAAYLLKRAGKRVVLLEGCRIGTGTTGSSTCKLTSQQQLIYSSLISKYGIESARLYGEMQEAAISQVEELVAQLKLDCDFIRKPHATWTSEESKVKEIEQEVTDSKKLGLPAELVHAQDLELPPSIGVKAGIRFANQGEFNAYKYCVELAKHVEGDGCKVYEGTRVSATSGMKAPHKISFEGQEDFTLMADQVILATHLPIMDRSGHVMLLPPSKSHVIAVKLGAAANGKVGAGDVRGMYINADSVKRSIRTTQNGSVLIVSGESFETGDETDVEERYQALEKWAHEHFQVEKNLTRWSAMDFYSSTILPYIGKLYRGSDSIYTATGFSKWGLTNGVAAGMIVRDLIMNTKNPWAELVDARRWDLHAIPGAAMEQWHVSKHLISDKIKARFAPSIETLKPGEGNTVKAGSEIVGAYLDTNGKYHLVKPICTHMGCNVVFNKTDRVWDCPCHGSQFDIDGKVVHGPAVKNLCKYEDLKW